MEAVLTQLRSVLELLAVAQTERVREWDRDTVQRALRWAEYCERLLSRFRSNAAVRRALESALSDANQRLRDTVPSCSPVELSELAHCRHALLVRLLRNPYAPNCAVQMLFPDQCDQSSLIASRSAVSLLSRALDRTRAPGLPVDAEVRGELLRTLLDSLLTRPGNEEHARSVLDSVLRDSAGGMERLYDVIAAALLRGDDESGSARVILAWLRRHEGRVRGLCRSLSPGLCAVLARRCPEFAQEYRGVLKQWASCLEYDVLESVWAPTSDGTVTFSALADRFKELMDAGAPLKEDTERELRALTRQDGDFRARGISVWTDLTTRLDTGR